jgi:hypothetical protein
VVLTQRWYIADRKSAERLDRPKENSEFALVLVLFLGPVLTGQLHGTIWNKSYKVRNGPTKLNNVTSRDLRNLFSSRLLGGSFYEVELRVLRLALFRSSNSVH